MLNLKGYKAELVILEEIRKALVETYDNDNKKVTVKPVTIDSNSTDSQQVYAIGLLNSKIEASKELGVDTQELENDKKNIKLIRKTQKEYAEYSKFYEEQKELVRLYKKGLSQEDLVELHRESMLSNPLDK